MSGPSYQCFRACVRKASVNSYVDVPKRVSRALADEAVEGRIAVEGLLNTYAFRSTLIPLEGNRHRLFLNAAMRRGADVEASDMVVVALRPAELGIPAPADVAAGFRKVKGAVAAFDALSPLQRHERLRYIDEARRPETRVKRIQETAERLGRMRTDQLSQRKVRALWTCPTCGQQFPDKDHVHDCHRYRLDEVFAGKPPVIRELFDRFRDKAEKYGPVRLRPQRNRVAFTVGTRFATAAPKSKWLDISLWLPERIKNSRFIRIETINPQTHVHSLRVIRPEEVDDQLGEWLAEAHTMASQAEGK